MVKRAVIKFPKANLGYTKMLREWMDILHKFTKEEADFMEKICQMTDEQKNTFVMAKKLFEDRD